MTTAFASKLPNRKTSIFSIMSALSAQHEAINLSQGFPDYAVDPKLTKLIYKYMELGFNQYAPMPGDISLRESIRHKYHYLYDLDINSNTEITVTAGATQALFTAIAATVRPGDEVIIFEPAYDSYGVTVELFGGKVIPIRLTSPDFIIDWKEVAQKVNERTRLIIINNPNNPTGRVFSDHDFKQLSDIIKNSNAYLLSDEVYEHLVFDGIQSRTVLQDPVLRERAFVVASFGKLLHATGWKIGYCIANETLTDEFRKVHQFNVFSVHSPTQRAIGEYIENPENYINLPTFFQEKRDYLIAGLRSSRFNINVPQGTYFLNVDYKDISDLPENEFAISLVEQHKIATIPTSAFYSDRFNQHQLRICFAKQESTLEKAIQRLNNI